MRDRGEYREDKKSFVQTRDGERFNLSLRTAIAPASRVPYRFDHAIVCLTQVGRIRFTTDTPGVSTTHASGDLLLLPAGHPLYTDYLCSSHESPLECLTLELDGELINEVTAQLTVDWPDNESVDELYTVNDVSEFVHAESCATIRRIDALLDSQEQLLGRDNLITKATQELILLLLQSHARTALLSPPSGGTRRVERAIEYIRAHIREELRVEQLATVCHMSEASFYEHFRQCFGVSPAAFVRELRVSLAREMLVIHQQMSLKLVAAECGFANPTSFSQTFKAVTGESPRAFRRRRLAVH